METDVRIRPDAVAEDRDDRGRLAARPVVALGAGVIALQLVQVAAISDLPVVGRLAAGALALLLVAAALLGASARGRGRRGAALLLLGLLGVLPGAAIGAMHARATGLSVTAVLGIAGLAAGLGLTVAGTVTAVGALRGWRRLWALPVAVVLLQLVVLTVPFALYVTHPPVEAFDAATPPGVETVRVPTADGVTLAAWYHPSANGAAVVLRHGSGAGSSKAGLRAHAELLARHGYGVLAMDARGHGESGGRAMDWGWYGDLDVAAGLDWLAARPEVDPGRLGGVGLSMGGEELLGAAGTDARLRAVVAEGATGRTAADRDHLGYTGYERAVDRLTSAITFGVADLFTRASPPTALADAVTTATGTRILLIAADVPAEHRAAEHLASLAPDRVDLWLPEATPHTDALERHPGEWEQQVVTLLDGALAP